MKFLLVFLMTVTPALFAQEHLDNTNGVVDRISAREKALLETLDSYIPIAETYLQVVGPDGEVERDHYFLSQAKIGTKVDGVRFKGVARTNKIGRYAHWAVSVNMEYEAEGFIQMSHPMMDDFDRDHYNFEFLQHEPLDGVKCLEFRVSPRAEYRHKVGMYDGLIWAEDAQYTIVRYQGNFRGGNDLRGHYFHFDTQRVALGNGLWVPAAIYTEERSYAYNKLLLIPLAHLTFKAQTRFWGYQRGSSAEKGIARPESETNIQRPTNQNSEVPGREEDNVIRQLENISLLAPLGPSDNLLERIARKLEVSSGLHIFPAVRCRELLTTRMEFFTVGHTIVISRGLLDVVPDEATAASIVALGLARINLDIRDSKAYLKKELSDPSNVFQLFDFASPSRSRKQLRNMAESYFTQSEYKNSTESVSRFFAELVTRGASIRQLLTANLGDSPWDHVLFPRSPAPQLDSSQHFALPLGSRTTIDPWTDDLTVRLDGRFSEEHPFEIIAFSPETSAPQ